MRSFKLMLLSTALIPAAAHSQQADPSAQQAAEPATTGGEGNIVVTARRMGETLLDTPASVSIISSEALETRNVTNMGQLGSVVRGVVMTNGVAGTPSITMRGLGSNASSFGLESSVAQYQDGVYLAHFRDSVAPLYDVAQIEVIRGTQSTLLGKNTSVGALSIVTQRPTKEFGAEVTVAHSFGIGGDRADGYVNIPLSPDLSVRGSFLASDQQGYMRNAYLNRREPQLRELSGRIALQWDPSDVFGAYLSYQHDDRDQQGQLFQVIHDPRGVIVQRAAALGQANFNVLPDTISGSASRALGGASDDVDPFDRQYTNRLNGILTLSLGDYTVTSQTAFFAWKANRHFDLDFTAANLYNIIDIEKNRTFSQELRLNSPKDQALEWLVGAYYYYNKWDYNRIFRAVPPGTVPPAANAGLTYPGNGSANGTLITPTKSISLFGSATLTVTDGLKLSAGARYTNERKTATIQRTSVGQQATPFPSIPFTILPESKTNNLDYDVGIRYELPSSVLFYASYSRGSKSGGFQEFPATAAASPYLQEVAYSAEVGVKAPFSFGSITAALFNTRVQGFQASLNTTLPGSTTPVSRIGNANIRSRGFEAAADIRLSNEFRVGGSVLFIDGTYTKDFIGSQVVALKGDHISRAPRWSGKVNANYRTDITDDLRFSAGADLNLTQAYELQVKRLVPDQPVSKKRAELDLNFSIEDVNRGLKFSVVGTNMTNVQYVDFASPVTGGAAAGVPLIGNRAFYGSVNRPRVIAVQLRYKM